ncbi:spore germination protein GerPE [Bacillus sp. FJAT-42376]|uniref:spore germination protein GerPE n=1 Tax=Bacillus sp. FJAT-42376 TaxID=2014076 RepID=UPI000F501BB1|nr:spore germination protein GerPE [Bacillus sp. FJAT-42376]AZB42281.1 spore germination protein GerPE [Bacillus sp. FJAT-42376]
MYNRNSIVDAAYVNILGFSSVFNIGDSREILPKANVFAVQREAEVFYDNEGDFSKYDIFQLPVPRPIKSEQVAVSYIHEKPFIRTKFVKILALSTSAVFQIGSADLIEAEARVKHTRQLFRPKGVLDPEEQSGED